MLRLDLLFEDLIDIWVQSLALVNKNIHHEVQVDICVFLAHLQVILLDEVGSDVDLLPFFHAELLPNLHVEQVHEVFPFAPFLSLTVGVHSELFLHLFLGEALFTGRQCGLLPEES